MSELQPAAVAREARSIHAGLKALLARDVWSNYREADFQRKNLRRRYLNLLLLHPSSKEARDAGTHLWMQTSYAFIALYKQRLARQAHPNNGNGNGPGPVETRKLQQRFRQFLADEERFWRALVLRLQRAYDVVLPSTVALPPELTVADEDADATPEDRNNHFGFPAATEPPARVSISGPQAASVLSKALVCLGDIARYREQYRAPPKLPPHIPEPKKRLYEHRPNYARARALYFAAHALAPHEGNAAHQLAILAGYESDTLASVAWYLRALCVRAPFDTAGENLAGVLTRALAHPQSRNVIEAVVAREADPGAQDEKEESEPLRVRVERFKRDLVLLHALWRDASAPPHQTLALSSHTARAFARLVSARALPEELIVRVGVLAQGAVWAGRMQVHATTTVSAVADSGDDFATDKEKEKERKRRGGRNAKPAAASKPALAPTALSGPQKERLQAAHLAHLFALHTALLGVGVRELGEVDVYAHVGANANNMAAAIGVPMPGTGTGRGRRGRGGANNHHTASSRVAGAGVGGSSVGDPNAGAKSKPDLALAERISAEFRRTLPALRVGSKWVLANWGWVAGVVPSDANAHAGHGGGGGENGSEEETELRAQLERFWATYAEFLRMLARTFPVGELPSLSTSRSMEGVSGPEGREGEDEEEREKEHAMRDAEGVELELELEEDLDMRGWLPLRGLMGGPCPLPSSLVDAPAADTAEDDGEGESDDAHANDNENEEQRRQAKLEKERRTVGLKEEVHPNVEQLMRIRDLLRDGRRIVELEGSPLALYGGQFVVKGVEAEKPAALVSARAQAVSGMPVVPSPYSVVVPNLRLAAMQMQMHGESEDEAMTEQTSRTDDDILRDAFSFLDNGSELESDGAVGGPKMIRGGDSDEEDQIVWDLRDAPVSPIAPMPMPTATARTSPKTPMRPAPIGTLSSRRGSAIAPPGLGLGASAPPPLSPFRTPQSISPGAHVPGTTALDLLNSYVLSKAPAKLSPIGTGIPAGTGGGESLLFGAGAAARGAGPATGMAMSPAHTQSIWSASRNEQGMMFSGGGGGGPGVIGQQLHAHQVQSPPQLQQVVGPGPQYYGLGLGPGPGPGPGPGLSPYASEHHGHGHGHQRFASQDISISMPMSSQGTTIWQSSPAPSSSYPTASQHHVPTGLGFGIAGGGSQQPIGTSTGIGVGTAPISPLHSQQRTHHQRVVSSSMVAAQLFPSGNDMYGYGHGHGQVWPPAPAPGPQQYAGGV